MNQLFGWSEQAWLTIDQVGILVGLGVGLVSVGTFCLAVIGFFKRDSLRRWLLGNRFPRVGETDISSEDWDGIIFTVSRPDVPCWVIDQCKPRVIGLVYTEGSESAKNKIEAHARGVGCIPVSIPIEDPDDPAETRKATAYLISRIQNDSGVGTDGISRLGIDITGGKVPMSLGAFMAAEEASLCSLYIATTFSKGVDGMDIKSARIVRLSQPEAGA